jgi:uncharacterized protein
MDPVSNIIQTLGLYPHPEGGYFRETYRSQGEIGPECLVDQYPAKRSFATCIYFLLTYGSFSAFHCITQDEIWHFYDGSPLHLHLITQQGNYSKIAIGRNLDEGEVPQFVVPGGTWFAATVINPNGYSLVGCTVSPGFDFADFELGMREALISRFPQHSGIIKQLTRE